jgi:hypothetical protein
MDPNSVMVRGRGEQPPALHLRKVRFWFWSVALAAGFLQAWASRFAIEPDGVNYLDLAQAYLRQDWHNAINAYWSPLYSWQLGLALLAGPSSLYWESTLLHLVNFFNYLVALGCFVYCLREWTALRAESSPSTSEWEGLPNWAWQILACALCLYAMLELIRIRTDTPDLCVAAAFFLASGIIIKMRRGDRRWRLSVLLGIILGLGYLAKAIMFPLAFVFLFAALFGSGGKRLAWGRALLALAVFLVISAPFVLALSRAKGRFTYGDAGRLNYAFYVNGLPRATHWHGEVPGGGVPVHEMRRLSETPPVDEFSEPISGTYPPWYDASYWFEGVKPHFEWRGQLRALRESSSAYFHILSAEKGVAVGLLVLVLFSGNFRSYARELKKAWPVCLPALAALGIYALIHVETRLVGPAVVMLWCALFGAVRMPRSDASRRVAACVTLAVTLVLATTVMKEAAEDLARSTRRTPHTQWDAAMGLRRLGLHQGDRVAVLGHTNEADYWAHLAQLRIVADLPLDALPEFWSERSARRKEILALFAQAGAQAVITREIPRAGHAEGWQPIGDSGYFVVVFPTGTAHAGG